MKYCGSSVEVDIALAESSSVIVVYVSGPGMSARYVYPSEQFAQLSTTHYQFRSPTITTPGKYITEVHTDFGVEGGFVENFVDVSSPLLKQDLVS